MSFLSIRKVEEGEEDRLFKMSKKSVKDGKSAEEITSNVEHVMAELEVSAEDDAELNRQGRPAINKLKRLSLLTDALSKKPLQQEFLDRGLLALLKSWLDTLPDGSLPNINIRTAVLTVLNDLPIDLEDCERRKQLKMSGLGKVIAFMAKSDEETAANRKLAKQLFEKWNRKILKKSTRFEDTKNAKDKRVVRKLSSTMETTKTVGIQDDLSLAESSQQRASIPEPVSMDFVIRPPSKVDPVEVRARAKHLGREQHHLKLKKKLDQQRAPKRKQLQAIKLSADGHGMAKYI